MELPPYFIVSRHNICFALLSSSGYVHTYQQKEGGLLPNPLLLRSHQLHSLIVLIAVLNFGPGILLTTPCNTTFPSTTPLEERGRVNQPLECTKDDRFLDRSRINRLSQVVSLWTLITSRMVKRLLSGCTKCGFIQRFTPTMKQPFSRRTILLTPDSTGRSRLPSESTMRAVHLAPAGWKGPPGTSYSRRSSINVVMSPPCPRGGR